MECCETMRTEHLLWILNEQNLQDKNKHLTVIYHHTDDRYPVGPSGQNQTEVDSQKKKISQAIFVERCEFSEVAAISSHFWLNIGLRNTNTKTVV